MKVDEETLKSMRLMKEKGFSHWEISKALGLSYHTVRYHLDPEYRASFLELAKKYYKPEKVLMTDEKKIKRKEATRRWYAMKKQKIIEEREFGGPLPYEEREKLKELFKNELMAYKSLPRRLKKWRQLYRRFGLIVPDLSEVGLLEYYYYRKNKIRERKRRWKERKEKEAKGEIVPPYPELDEEEMEVEEVSEIVEENPEVLGEKVEESEEVEETTEG